jgi:hypothetical protein
MRNARHYSSNRKVAFLLLSTVLCIAGCSAGSSLLSADNDFLAKLNIDALSPLTTASTSKAPVILRPRVEPAGEIEIVPDRPQSAWCEHLKENAAVETTILRAPSINGSVNDSGRASLGISMSASSFKKARLLEEEALVKCRRYLAETGLKKLVFVSPQNLTAAGYRAKSNAILSQTKEMKKLRREINAALSRGAIDREKATAITVLLERLVAEGNAAKSQADRRFNEHMLSDKSAAVMSAELLKAEADLDHITSDIRSADALDVSVQAGWGDDVTSNGVNLVSQAFSGKVSFSMKLGAFMPQRYEHERLATKAKQEAIGKEEGGTIWQIGVLRRAHERAISGLEGSQQKLELAIKEANHLLAVLASTQQPEFDGARFNTRYEIIKLKADRAGVAGSIAEIKANLNRLQNG